MYFTLENRGECFDFVHIVKSIRNNWITEKTGELEFNYRGENYVAKWDQIRKLQKLEDGNLIKMPKLIYVAASPKPIERQKVDTCLKVFSDETLDGNFIQVCKMTMLMVLLHYLQKN